MLVTAAAAASQQGGAPNDAQIAHIAYTAGESNVAAGRQALAKSRGARLRAGDGPRSTSKLSRSPSGSENPTSTAETKHAELSHLNGAAFDRAYVANEVAYHRTVNGALRNTLIPSAQNGELKSLLQTGLTLFSEHQAQAEHLAMSLK